MVNHSNVGEPADSAAQDAVRVPSAKVGLSTTATYPESASVAFELAAKLGYDGVEVMVFTDPVTQEVEALRRLSDHYGVPILAIHAPCLLVTQRVWGTEPWAKLDRSRAAAEELGASTVVVHPPFRWQREYARNFVSGVARMAEATDVVFAVENMYPWKAVGREAEAYAPTWDPSDEDYANVTLDLSHTAVSGSDAAAMARGLGDRLAHLHLTDGSGSNRDEHLVPGRGSQPCAEVLELLARRQFSGTRDRRGVDAEGGEPGRPGGRPRRGAGVRPAEPGGRDRGHLALTAAAGPVVVAAAQSSSYDGPPDLTAAHALVSWGVDLPALVLVALLGAWYVGAVRRVRHRGASWSVGRSIAWGLGLLTIVVATQSFLGVYAHTLFWVYTTQITLLLTLAPVLLALGGPVSLVVAADPARQPLVDRVNASWPVRVLSFPLVGAVLLAAFPFLLFFTGWFEATLRSGVLYALTHVVLLVVGFCFYSAILGVDHPPRLHYAAVTVIVLMETLLDSVPGIVLWLRQDLVAGDYYRELARPWGRSLLSDQSLGGLMFWGIGELIGAPLILLVAIQWMRLDAQEARRIDAELDQQEAEAAVIAAAEAAARGEDVGTTPGPDEDGRR